MSAVIERGSMVCYIFAGESFSLTRQRFCFCGSRSYYRTNIGEL